MPKKDRLIAAAVLVIVIASVKDGWAQIPPAPLAPLTMTSEPGPRKFSTDHIGVFNGKRIEYRAEVGETIIRDAEQHPTASLISTSYIASGVTDTAIRPVLFAFNGGPGGSSVFLRFGSLGPKILPSTLGSEAADAKPILVDNPLSPLDVTDLVFVDPTDTGFSHTLPGVSTRQFNSIDGDSEATTQLVINWLRVHHRLDSPVYIYGESYGSMRAVAMTRDLARSTPKIVVAGLMIGGNSLGYFQKGQMPDILYEANALPMMASVAWHYGKIDNQHQTWEQAVDKARFFARTQYISALIMGFSLDSATRENVIRQLPDIIGIPESYFRKHNTIVVKDFCAELLRDSGLVIDRDNGLRTMPASAPPQKFADVIRRYGEYMDFYAANELGVVGLGGYQTIHPDIVRLGGEWNYLTAGAMALDVTLATVMKENPKLRFMMTQGRYDTLTTLGNSEYIIAQTDIPLDRYTEAYYDAGHSLKPLPEVMTAIHKFIENR